MGWRDALDWEEGVFRGLLSVWKRAAPRPGAKGSDSAATFEDEERALRVLAQVLTGEPMRIRRSRGLGGLRGADILLPASIDLFPDPGANREAYRVQVVVACGMRRLRRDIEAPAEDSFGSAVASLSLAHEAAELMCRELPRFREAHDRVLTRVLMARSWVDLDRLPPLEAELELARRAALVGELGSFDRLRDGGQRVGRRRSPEVPVWGAWFPSGASLPVGSPRGETESADELSTELDAPETEGITHVELQRDEEQDSVPVVPFENVESLDSYRGGQRDLDGTDELEAHLEALQEVDLGELFQGSETSQSLLKADLELGRDIADAVDGDSSKHGIPYDEWDARRGVYRRAWCTVFAEVAPDGDPSWAIETLAAHQPLVESLKRRIEVHRAGLRVSPRQFDGEEIDVDAAVDERVTQLAGRAGDGRVYQRQERRRRAFATTVLLDVSMSTDSWVEGRRVLDVSREATLVLGEVAGRIGDRLQVLAFASQTRNRCEVWEILGFDDGWHAGLSRISGLKPRGYTRIGPALRHATAQLAAEPAEKRLLLLVTDGKPTDYDRYEGRYGIADVRQALREASRSDVYCHALAVDSVARDYLPALFGETGWHVLAQPESLLEALTEVYGRLTAR